jgi:hypothetical protein
MPQKYPFAAYIFSVMLLVSCAKKNLPVTSVTPPGNKEVIVAKVIHTPVPKVISVTDSLAKKSVDGRLYYDLMGRRYWRNNKDGKYYLFNKAMYSNPAYAPVKKDIPVSN